MTYVLPNALRSVSAVQQSAPAPMRSGLLRPLARIRFQLIGGLLFAVLLPALFRSRIELHPAIGSLENSVLGTAAAMILGAYIIRRIMPLPGVQANLFVLPAFVAVYAGVAIVFLILRIDYSRFQFLASFALAAPWFWLVSIVERRYKRPLLAVLPVGDVQTLTGLLHADWHILQSSNHPPIWTSGVVADLRANLAPEWERLLALSALKGLPVYHSKHVVESFTGRVEIEHLSENSLGSLLPSSIYLKIKCAADTLVALLALPFVFPLGCVIAYLIRREDSGPALFSQPRMGHGGEVFSIFKFRTMKVGSDLQGHFTTPDDDRITRIGRYLRRYRIDELPQLINILRGEMSWIGPRPESVPLANRYERKIPFYSYRHIVRPGITGWAQVQQGYAAEVQAVTGKLHYDFFYIKHFSFWLDLLIVARTIRTILTGFGAR